MTSTPITQHPYKVAIALSGGRDSMALAHKSVTREGKNNVLMLHVNHNLQQVSHDMAEKVRRWCKAQGWHLDVLEWHGAKPKTGIEAAARDARYGLLFEACHRHKIPTLALAHHADDQMETVLMRLASGSGLDGLCGMADRQTREGIQIIRPLLKTPRSEITDYVESHSLPYLDDPMNGDERFTRARFRRFLQTEGLSAARLHSTLERLRRAAETLEHLVDQFPMKKNVIDYNAWLELPEELQIRVLLRMIRATHPDTDHPVRLERLESALDTIRTLPASKAYTIGRCLFRYDGSELTCIAETR